MADFKTIQRQLHFQISRERSPEVGYYAYLLEDDRTDNFLGGSFHWFATLLDLVGDLRTLPDLFEGEEIPYLTSKERIRCIAELSSVCADLRNGQALTEHVRKRLNASLNPFGLEILWCGKAESLGTMKGWPGAALRSEYWNCDEAIEDGNPEKKIPKAQMESFITFVADFSTFE